jgi:hypothetical protein
MPVHALREVREVAAPFLPDIAMVSLAPDGEPVIFYNPILCRQAGPALCEFYRYHEYGHIALGHHEREELSVRDREQAADHWAARHAPLSSVIAAYKFFSAGGGGTPFHGQSSQRAARMLVRTGVETRLAQAGAAATQDSPPEQRLAANERNGRIPLMSGALAL